jgi:hypothetical protein
MRGISEKCGKGGEELRIGATDSERGCCSEKTNENGGCFVGFGTEIGERLEKLINLVREAEECCWIAF